MHRRCHACVLLLTATLTLGGCGGPDSATGAPAASERIGELRTLSSAYVDHTLDDIQASSEALGLAAELFAMHCTECHGANGTADKGTTNLTLGRFDYGTTADAIRTTIRDGRTSEMPRMGNQYGEVELGQLVAYVETLASGATPNDYEARGKESYETSCAACHGEDGHGQPALGAPDLTDGYWQHGESMMNQRLVITRGVSSTCPAQGSFLTPVEIELLTAYVLNLIGS